MQSLAPSFRPMNTDKPTWLDSFPHRIDFVLLTHTLRFSAQVAGGYVGLRAIMVADDDGSLIRYLCSRVLFWANDLLYSGIPIPLLMSSWSRYPVRESMLVRNSCQQGRLSLRGSKRSAPGQDWTIWGQSRVLLPLHSVGGSLVHPIDGGKFRSGMEIWLYCGGGE